MDIEFFGANCFRVKTKEVTIFVDDTLNAQGSKSPLKNEGVAVYTQKALVDSKVAETARLVIDSAGEYEVGDVTIRGIQARAHMDEEGQPKTAVVYQMLYDNASITFLGHVHPDIASEVLEIVGGTDVLAIPVGGNGYTLDAVAATKLIKEIEPDAVVPTYFEDSKLKFEVPPAPLENFVKTSGLQAKDPVESIKLGKVEAGEGSQTALVVMSAKS